MLVLYPSMLWNDFYRIGKGICLLTGALEMKPCKHFQAYVFLSVHKNSF